MPKKIDWAAIRDAFISNERDLTYSDIASMFGVSRQAVELKASPKAENWQALREAFRLTNTSKSTIEPSVAKPNQAEPSSTAVAHQDPEESPFPEKHREPRQLNINQILEDAIFQSSDALKELEPRSFERTATVLTALIKAYSELNPPTLEALVEKIIQLGYTPKSLVEEMRKWTPE